MKRILFFIAGISLMFNGVAKADDTANNNKLAQAARKGNTTEVQALLDKGADINAYYYSATGLMYASENGHVEVVKLLLDRGANLNMGKAKSQSTDFHPGLISSTSFNSGSLEDQATALYLASKNGHTNIVKLLMDKGADVSLRTTTSKLSGSDISINRGATTVYYEKKKTPLDIANEKGHKEIVQLLGKPTKEMGLIIAAEDNNITEVQALLGQGADVNIRRACNGSTALWIASHKGYTELARLLLEKGADFNLTTMVDGAAPIYVASQNGHADIVRLLLDKGADMNVKRTSVGDNALIVASQKGNTEVVKLLLEKGADVKEKKTDGVTAIIIASDNGHTKVVKLLIENGADVNAKRTSDGINALMFASQKGHTDIVQALIDKGADVNIKGTVNNKDWSALKAAKKFGRKDIVEILKSAGAKE